MIFGRYWLDGARPVPLLGEPLELALASPIEPELDAELPVDPELPVEPELPVDPELPVEPELPVDPELAPVPELPPDPDEPFDPESPPDSCSDPPEVVPLGFPLPPGSPVPADAAHAAIKAIPKSAEAGVKRMLVSLRGDVPNRPRVACRVTPIGQGSTQVRRTAHNRSTREDCIAGTLGCRERVRVPLMRHRLLSWIGPNLVRASLRAVVGRERLLCGLATGACPSGGLCTP
jgi:hypothetical protein